MAPLRGAYSTRIKTVPASPKEQTFTSTSVLLSCFRVKVLTFERCVDGMSHLVYVSSSPHLFKASFLFSLKDLGGVGAKDLNNWQESSPGGRVMD